MARQHFVPRPYSYRPTEDEVVRRSKKKFVPVGQYDLKGHESWIKSTKERILSGKLRYSQAIKEIADRENKYGIVLLQEFGAAFARARRMEREDKNRS